MTKMFALQNFLRNRKNSKQSSAHKDIFPIKGFTPVTLLDWPGRISALLFVGGCNFRCPFCYNKELVINPEKEKTIDVKEIFEYLNNRKKWIDAVCITGGEPTLYEQGLENFCQKIKNLKFLIQIQTNGTNPELLDKLINAKLIDYIAMDIKGPIQKYDQIVNVNVDKEKIKQSVRLIKSNPQIQSEFRTTIVPKMHNEDDIKMIGEWLGPNCRIPFYLQQFQNGKTLDPKFQYKKPYLKPELEKMTKIAKKYFKKVKLRGI